MSRISLFCRFFAINTIIIYFYFSTFQKVDEEEYGGIMELLKEGLMTSFASFLVNLTVKVIILGRRQSSF